MGSLSSPPAPAPAPAPAGNEYKDTVITQVSIAGFDEETTTAKDLALFLEQTLNCAIWRSRLKTSCTPLESFPEFSHIIISSSSSSSAKPRTIATPHAFLHFNTADGAARAINAAGRCDLLYKSKPLIALSTTDSPFRIQRRRTTDPFRFPDVGFRIGSLVAPTHFLTSWNLDSSSGAEFLIDPFDNCCKFVFSRDVGFSIKDTNEVEVIKCDLKLEFLLRDVTDLKVSRDENPFVLMFQLGLGSAPLIHYRTADDDIYDMATGNLLDDEDPWIRTTDFTPNGAIGRCSYYQVSVKPRHGGKLRRALAYMKERRIDGLQPERPIVTRDEPVSSSNPGDPFFCFHYEKGVSFANMFMVNALVHKGVLNQHRLTGEFFDLLRTQSEELNDVALRHIYAYRNPVFDACGRLKLVQNWLLKYPKFVNSAKPSNDNMEVRRLVITPTKAYCLPPEIELSNRVLRKFKKVSDRFLRVTFMDEGMQPLNSNVLNLYDAPIVREITKNSYLQKTAMYRRVGSIMNDGFYLCGRKYSFLAFSQNQLRDQSAWFFAETSELTINFIVNWMGKFINNNVAKYAARMGQCFSSTYTSVVVPPREVDWKIKDVKRNNYCFSDGIGKITPTLAAEVASKLQLTVNPPSAYQIRYAGCKGVVAVWPEHGDVKKLSLRPSMNKFQSVHTTLEIVSWTRFQPGFLNRQIITLLSALDVPDEVFSRMQDSMVCKLDQMLVDPDVAFEVLTKSCAEQGNIAALMLSAGFKPHTEPHLKAMLSCIRLAQLKDLAAKARIFVEKGRWLMGCLDELGVLKQGQCFIQVSRPSLENCFLKHGSRFSGMKEKKQVIMGTVALAKNPCLHPGDIRILEAVDVPGLHHLVDCFVFPQKGDRPHANEASGSDLDGDLYFVTWDENLIPPSKRSWMPMAYTSAKPKIQPRQIIHQDIIEFFVKSVSNENLGKICNAHVVHADQSEYGAMDEKCLKLAEMAATAVDFPKTGKSVYMPASLKPKVYPDFMDKGDRQSYKSEKILGRLYRKIKDASDHDNSSELVSGYEDIPYDTDLELQDACDYLLDAWDAKCSYDRQLNALLGQYQVDKEGEVVTGHICSLAKYNSRKQGEIKERLQNAYYALQKQYRSIFEEIGQELLKLTDDARNLVYERKASAWYQVTYHPQWVKKSIEMRKPDGGLVSPRLSFAWVAVDFLVRIKVRCRDVESVGGRKPIDSLANYLRERM